MNEVTLSKKACFSLSCVSVRSGWAVEGEKGRVEEREGGREARGRLGWVQKKAECFLHPLLVSH